MMKPLNPVTYRPLRDQRSFLATFDGTTVRVTCENMTLFTASVESIGDEARLKTAGDASSSTTSLVRDLALDLGLNIALEFLFGHFPNLKQATVVSGSEMQFERASFFQRPDLWLHDSKTEPEVWAETNGRRHPVRPKTRTSTYYRRYVPNIQKHLSFRTVEIERDLTIFHAWQNRSRVADLWELNKPIDELKAYLEKGLHDPHSIPMIVEFDEEPVGYFEMYWTPEDRLGPYYEYAPYDRGFHFLIGEEKFLGLANTDAVLRSVTHFLFVDDSRTNKILGEPRADNKRVLKYVESVPGWRFIKEFDFPHKRAALLAVERDSFFNEGAL